MFRPSSVLAAALATPVHSWFANPTFASPRDGNVSPSKHRVVDPQGDGDGEGAHTDAADRPASVLFRGGATAPHSWPPEEDLHPNQTNMASPPRPAPATASAAAPLPWMDMTVSGHAHQEDGDAEAYGGRSEPSFDSPPRPQSYPHVRVVSEKKKKQDASPPPQGQPPQGAGSAPRMESASGGVPEFSGWGLTQLGSHMSAAAVDDQVRALERRVAGTLAGYGKRLGDTEAELQRSKCVRIETDS